MGRHRHDTIAGYQYRYRNAAGTAWNPGWTNIPGSGANTTAFTLTGLTNGIEYTFEVRAVYLQDGQEKNGREGTVKSTPGAPWPGPAACRLPKPVSANSL